MSIEIKKYARKPFYVDAVQVTDKNLDDVAKWCSGDVRTMKNPKTNKNERYVKVRVHSPLTPSQSQAFVGDWVLYAATGYKVYTTNAFVKNFEPK